MQSFTARMPLLTATSAFGLGRCVSVVVMRCCDVFAALSSCVTSSLTGKLVTVSSHPAPVFSCLHLYFMWQNSIKATLKPTR